MTEREMQNILYRRLCFKLHHKYITPNVRSLFFWECDMVSVTQAGYINEFEIKITHADFKADMKKRKHHFLELRATWRNIQTYFWYVIHGFELGIADIPEYAGLMIVERGWATQKKRAPRLNKIPITEKQIQILHIATYYRYWNNRLKVGGNPC